MTHVFSYTCSYCGLGWCLRADISEPENEYNSPGSSSTGQSTQVQVTPFSDRSPQQSVSTLYTSDTGGTSRAVDLQHAREHAEPNYDDDYLSEDSAQALDVHQTGHLGQVCEVVWLHSLLSRVCPSSMGVATQLSETDFYLHAPDIQSDRQHNPFELPTEETAFTLLRCYLTTVYVTYPMVPTGIERQLQLYFHSQLHREPFNFDHRWFAIIHLIFAISARFSRLTNAQWAGEKPDERIHRSNACQLLSLSYTAMVPTRLSLLLIQVCL